MKKNESTNIFESLKLAHEKCVASELEETDLKKKMDDEIEEATRKIELEYQEKIKRSKRTYSTLEKILHKYQELLATYSTFEISMIGSILEKLVSFIEGETYSFQKATHATFERETTPFGSEAVSVDKEVLMLVKGDKKEGFYSDYNEQSNEITRLVKSQNAILLSERSRPHKGKITFYTSSNGNAECIADFSNYSYIKEFIDKIVQFRFSNDSTKITERELLILLSEFIVSKKDLIEQKYKNREMELKKQQKDQAKAAAEKRQKEAEIKELDNLMQNGVPYKYKNDLLSRLQDDITIDPTLNENLREFDIKYEGQSEKANIMSTELIISSVNILISKIDIAACIKDYFDDTPVDPHFHGPVDIELIDDGLIGIISVDNLSQKIDDIKAISSGYGEYRVDEINDKYLRVLYLPNKGNYAHRSDNVHSIYSWILNPSSQDEEPNEPVSYKVDRDYSQEAKKMIAFLKEAELIGALNKNQLTLYKKRKDNK